MAENEQELPDSEEQHENLDESTSVDDLDDNDSSNDSNDSDSADNTAFSDSYEPSVEEIENLSDEEFGNWLSSNEFPTEKKTKKQDTENVETESTDVQADKPQQNTNIDYKSAYEQILKPFKANGKEIKPKDINDVVSLMQMGANYTRKMQKLAPMRRAAESLSKAGISDKDLSFLIDLHKGNKEAIKKLLKNNNLDITDIDFDEESKYQENYNNLATDEDLNFQDAIMDSSPENLSKMRDILDSWDADSRQKVLKDPNLIRGLDWEISSGRFEKIKERLDSERTFGRYKDYTDLQAYIALAQQYEQQQAQYSKSQTRKTNRIQSKTADKSKAAPSKGKSTPHKSNLTPKQLMEMPEEEFLKLNPEDLL